MRMAARMICLLLSGFAFGEAAMLSYRATFESHEVRFRLPQIANEKSSCLAIAQTGVGYFRFTFMRVAWHDGKSWVKHHWDREDRWYNFGGRQPLSLGPGSHEFAGFAVEQNQVTMQTWRDRRIRESTSWHTLVLPWWFVLLMTALPTAYFVYTIFRAHRPPPPPTLCKSCGYDLRAGHDKCPECGGESHVKIPAGENAAAQ